MEDLWHALRRMKANRCDDDAGLVAELVQFSPHHVLQELLYLYNDTLFSGEVPESWTPTKFMMLPKSRHARVPADYRPIANVRLFYKIFAYMMLARVEPALEIHQPEEQHGFRKGHRIEEHLLTANLVVDKLLAVSTPIWIVNLDFSKAFDRVSWDKLWVALQVHGISDHLVWTMQNLYTGQLGRIQGDTGDSRVFPITAGVRQGCVLSPRLFTAILQWAMQKWRQRVENSACGIDLENGGSKLLDLRFADDLLLFARSKFEAIFMLETLMEELAYVRLCLNAGKTVVLTNEKGVREKKTKKKTQPPQCLILTNQDAIGVKGNDVGHNWLGCILSAGAYGRSTLDTTFHLQAASRAFFANKQNLCDKKVHLAVRLRFFDRVITPVALFASGHRTIRMRDLYQMDITFRKLLRAMVGLLRALIGPAIGMSSFIRGMTGSKGSQTFSTLKRGPAVVWNIIGNWGGMLQIFHRNVGSAGYLLGTLWDVVALVAPGLAGRANLFRTLVIVIWAIGRYWLVILICGVD